MEENFDKFEVIQVNPESSVNSAMAKIDSVCGLVSNVTSRLSDTMLAVANTKLEIARMENDLDRFIAESQVSLEKFKAVAPILSTQLENASKRIDKITDTILSSSNDSLSEESLKKQSALVDLLNTSNDTFNNLLVKLIAI